MPSSRPTIIKELYGDNQRERNEESGITHFPLFSTTIIMKNTFRAGLSNYQVESVCTLLFRLIARTR